jgi:hypothetical protein
MAAWREKEGGSRKGAETQSRPLVFTGFAGSGLHDTGWEITAGKTGGMSSERR